MAHHLDLRRAPLRRALVLTARVRLRVLIPLHTLRRYEPQVGGVAGTDAVQHAEGGEPQQKVDLSERRLLVVRARVVRERGGHGSRGALVEQESDVTLGFASCGHRCSMLQPWVAVLNMKASARDVVGNRGNGEDTI
eukprot:scaffold99120_cov57-Phaeocystis_antarctica.AAC.1